MIDESATVNSVLRISARFLVALSLLLTLSCTACTGKTSVDLKTNHPSSSSEYTQTVINLPDDIYRVHSLEKTTSGKLWMVGVRPDPDSIHIELTSLWELNDNNSWKEVSDIKKLLVLSESEYVVASIITKNEKVVCFVADHEEYSSGLSFYIIDPKLQNYRKPAIDTMEYIGEPTEASIRNSVYWIDSLTDDTFLVRDVLNSLFVLDITNDTIKPIRLGEGNEAPSYFLSAAQLEGTSYVLHENISDGSIKLSTLDTSTGNLKSIGNEELTSLLDQNRSSSGVIPTMKAENNLSEKILFCLRDGIFEYHANEVRKIADGSDTVLSDPGKTVLGCVFDNDDDFYLLCVNHSNDVTSSPFSLRKYEKTAESKEASNALRVYALEDSTTVRQAIALYKDEHSDVEVSFEIGLNSEGMTAEDALKTLNTEMLAGNGPDVLILDGLPMESFIEQNQLHDLTDIYTEALDSGQYYDNVIGSFVSEGTCEVLPARYSFPFVVAEKGNADRLDSLSELENLTTEIVDESLGQRPFCNMPIFDSLFVSFYPEFFTQDELSKEALTRFFESISSLAKTLEAGGDQSSVLPNPKGAHNENEPFNSIAHGFSYLVEDPNQILIFEMLWEQDFLLNETFIQNSDAELVNESLSFNQNKSFVPRVCAAVNANINEIDLSKSFVRMLLSETCQSISYRDGLATMSSTFMRMSQVGFGVSLEDGSQLGIDSLSEETVAAYQTLFSSLDTPVVIDSVVRTTIYENMQNYLDGQVTLENGVDNCCQKINLYLAE